MLLQFYSIKAWEFAPSKRGVRQWLIRPTAEVLEAIKDKIPMKTRIWNSLLTGNGDFGNSNIYENISS